MPAMNKPLLLSLAAIATLFVTGCGGQQRDLVAMREVEIDGLKTQVTDLEGQVVGLQAENDSLRQQLSQQVQTSDDRVNRDLANWCQCELAQW